MAKSTKPQTTKGASEEKERTTIILRSDLMKSVKLIALFQDKSITELMETALQDLVEKWETKHGPLPKSPIQ